MKLKRLVTIGLIGFFAGLLIVGATLLIVSATLPSLITMNDYKPLLVSHVYSAKGEKIGEFFRERRIITPPDQIPEKLIKAFIAAEDASFFQHQGVNFVAIFRAFLANLRAGRTVQGGSTITQQVAKSLLLTPERTYTRKVKEIMLAYRMEAHLKKEEILHLYLNQIYLGQGAYGVAAAAETYFRKALKDLTVAEMAILAGLPQAPSRYTPIHNPLRAKERQRYVLGRMAEEGFITEAEAKSSMQEPVVVYTREDLRDKAPFFIETVRQYLVQTLGEVPVLDEGLKIYTSLDLEKQMAAQKSVQDGLRELDKRQGFRGVTKNLTDSQEVAKFLVETRDALIDQYLPARTISPEGIALPVKEPLNLNKKPGQPNLPEYIHAGDITQGIVTKVDDVWGVVTVRFAESTGLIDLETIKWARKPNPNVMARFEELTKPSAALKAGDVIDIKILAEKFQSSRIQEILQKEKKKNKQYQPKDLPDLTQFAEVTLEQSPTVESSLISFDLESSDILAMVGGYDFERNEFNRALQAVRQTGSSFKPIVYTAALDKGYNPASTIVDAPMVFEEEGQLDDKQDLNNSAQTDVKKWKPSNYSEKFTGDILFRNALIKSLNIPTIKILEKVTVAEAANYAKRLGVFSPMNMDLSLGLGSSGVTLYELTKVFSHFARMGKRTHPQFIKKVEDQSGKVLLEKVSLDLRFQEQIQQIDTEFEERRQKQIASQAQPVAEGSEPAKHSLLFQDPEQLLSPQTAYLMTSLLRGVVEEGTAQRAKGLGRVSAGKTGTTNGYFDAWYVGYTPQIVTGVWVGSDKERTLGRGETGASAALPIWLEYMKVAHKKLPEINFPVPSDIVFVNIDNETGHLASASSKHVVRQPFLEGTEPKSSTEESKSNEENFLKEDLAE
ncbi:MAG: penicillin-binding protein 1A [Bdellovibrionales bacterium]